MELLAYQPQENGTVVASQGGSFIIWLEFVSSVLLVIVTLGYVYLTYQLVQENRGLVEQNQKHVEEIRRAHHRSAVFDIILQGIHPLREQLEDHENKVYDALHPESGRPAFPVFPFTVIKYPPEYLWSDLVSEFPRISEVSKNFYHNREDYNDQRKPLINKLHNVLLHCSDHYTWTVKDLSKIEVREWIEDAKENESNVKLGSGSGVEDILEHSDGNPSKEEYADRLSESTEIDKETAKSVYEWLKKGDVALELYVTNLSPYDYGSEIGVITRPARDLAASILGQTIIISVEIGFSPIRESTREDLYELPWMVFPEDTEELKTKCEMYHESVERFIEALNEAEACYKKRYGIKDTELEYQRKSTGKSDESK